MLNSGLHCLDKKVRQMGGIQILRSSCGIQLKLNGWKIQKIDLGMSISEDRNQVRGHSRKPWCCNTQPVLVGVGVVLRLITVIYVRCVWFVKSGCRWWRGTVHESVTALFTGSFYILAYLMSFKVLTEIQKSIYNVSDDTQMPETHSISKFLINKLFRNI